MARVPVYNDTQVTPSALSPPAVRAPQADSAPATALSQAGASVGDVVMREQQGRNADRVMQAEAKVKADYLTYEQSQQERRGQDAWGVTNDVNKWWNDNSSKYLDGLENDEQRKLLQPTLNGMKISSLESAAKFEAAQRRESREQSAAASNAGSTAFAAGHWDNNGVVQGAKADITKNIDATATYNGWTPEIRDAKLADALTNLHKQVIAAMVDKDPERAQKYFDANKAEIAGDEQTNVEKLVRTGGLRVRSQDASTAILAQPDITEAEALKQARDKYKGEDEDAVVERITTHFSQQRVIEDQHIKDVDKAAWTAFEQGGRKVDSIPVPVYNELLATAPHALESMRSIEKGEKVQTNWDTYYTLRQMYEGDPAQFANVNLMNHANDLAPAQLESLINLQKAPKSALSLEQQMSATIANELKLSGKTSAEKQQIGQFKEAVQNEVAVQTAEKKRPLNDDERQKVIDKMIMQGTIPGGGWFGLWDKGARRYQTTGTDKGFTPDVTKLPGFNNLTAAEQKELQERATRGN